MARHERMSQLQSRRYIEEESAVNLNDILVKDAGTKRAFLLFPVYKKLLIVKPNIPS